ncbi:Trimethylguanosine synthase [Coemansia javaensis]|uniref:Trimethylguanosine synthase n=1 Tax=Coemansia javaensis TaxID=2761396 RepID=A0A9W8LFF7_9FUNG|nr:Trimethylguanosine synthase [Coemansia javaensis]
MGGKKKAGKRRKPKGQEDSDTFTTPDGRVLPASVQKYWQWRHHLFWRFDEGIEMDEEGWYSVTPESIAEHTAMRVAQLYGAGAGAGAGDGAEPGYGRLCVVEAFCGVGGNAIKFASWCEHVVAIDVDARRLAMARHNAQIYGVADRIEFVLGDFYALAPMLRADVVFMSPPWGGPQYTDADVFDLDALPFHTAREWLDRARLVAPNVAYFLPRSCDPHQLAALWPEAPCDVELNYTNGFLKAITAYYGDLALVGRSEPRVLAEPDRP